MFAAAGGGGGGGASSSSVTSGADDGGDVVVVVMDPEPFPPPVITPATLRDCQVMDDQQQVRWVRCLVSQQSGQAYSFVRSLRDCIFGVVRHAVALEQGTAGFYRYRVDRQVAIKCMSKAAIREQRGLVREDPIQELSALQLLSSPGHDHVQRLLECVQDAENIYCICPFYPGGELFSYLEARGGGLPEDKAREYFTQIVSGLEYMQRYRLSNRDLSLENILLTAAHDCVIIDMGMCIRVPTTAGRNGDGGDTTTALIGTSSHQQDGQRRRVLLRSQGQCGKLTYMAPEVFADQDFDGYAIDIWACGVILFILLAGVPPVEVPSLELDPRYRLIASGRLGELLDVWKMDHIGAGARDLLTRMLRAEGSERIAVHDILTHPWVLAAATTTTRT